MEFVTFHVNLGSGSTVHPNQTLKVDEYLSQIDMMFHSADKFHPGITATILTDLHTDLSQVTFPFKHIASKINPSRLMLERTSAQLQYILNHDFSAPLILLDSDILINGSLTPLFQQDFDIALTWRANPEMPINGGLLILNNRRAEKAKQFFQKFASIYLQHYADQASWFGDQLALRDCLGLTHEQMAGQDVVEVEGCRILLLPCDIYNFSPNNRYTAISSRLPEKRVLHFKGERKRLMADFWEAWLKPYKSWNPWTHIKALILRIKIKLAARAEAQAKVLGS